VFIPKLIICLRDYSWAQFRKDLLAGLIVGLVALPLAMAFAIASGVAPERGLYTAIIAGFLISALGGSRVQIGGPTGAFVVIVAGIVAKYGYDGLVVATEMAGMLLLLMGFCRLGSLVKFIPYPVTTGFTSGIAIIIFSSQIKDFLGLRLASLPVDFIAKWHALITALPTLNLWSTLIAVGTTACIARWPKSWQKLPGAIVALTAAAMAAFYFHLPVETIGSRFGGIPHGLPAPHWPSWSFAQAKILFPSALTIALLGSIESLLSAVVADGMIGGRHKSNMELIAQGVANIASPLFGGIPATGAIARTATNVKNGGRTPIAGITHAMVLFLILITAGPLAAHIPLAALSGVLVMVSYHMSEWHSFRFLMSGPWSDRLVLLTTFLLTVFVDLTVAVPAGIVLAALLFMRHMAELTEVKILTREISDDDSGKDAPRPLAPPADIEVFTIRGAFFFAVIHKLMEVNRIMAKKPRALILDMKEVAHMDASGLHMLRQIGRECQSRGIRFLIAGIHAQPLTVLDAANQITEIGEQNLKADVPAALQSLEAARTSLHNHDPLK
jgi:sulfate permease, SulP family